MLYRCYCINREKNGVCSPAKSAVFRKVTNKFSGIYMLVAVVYQVHGSHRRADRLRK